MELNGENILKSGFAGAVAGVALTMEEPQLGGAVLGALLGFMILYSASMEG